MPSPRYAHGFAHDVFISYTHADDALDAGRRWVTQFESDLLARLGVVSGHSVVVWRDSDKLGAADRFNETIAQAIDDCALLLVVLSPSYFNSLPCKTEREQFAVAIRNQGKESAGGKARVMKVAKFRVDIAAYPEDLQSLLEHKFYDELPGPRYKEFHLSEDPAAKLRYASKVDDVAQEIAGLLSGLETNRATESKGSVYLAEATSDLEPDRVSLRRRLGQLGYDVEPKQELRLLPPNELRSFITNTLRKCRLAVHPVGGYYGFVPEGAHGKSVVEIQLELARLDARNGDLTRIIWVPEGLKAVEDSQEQFLDNIRKNFAGRGFELLERPFRTLATRVEEQLRKPATLVDQSAAASGIYLVCHNADRSLAKTIRSFLFSQQHAVEWTPIDLPSEELETDGGHQKLLKRNRAHLVIHGETSDAWIQDRIRELNAHRELDAASTRLQAIYLANPHREDKDDILVRDVSLLNAYSPATVADAIAPFLAELAGSKGNG